MVNAQKWLDENYPRERRKIIELDIRNNYLEGELDLSDFVGLEKLNCSNNRLTNLVLPSNSTNLSYLDISDTDLDKIDVGKLPKSLETIKYCTWRVNCKLTEIVPQLKEYENEWKRDIHSNFTLKLRGKWEQWRFDKGRAKEWVNVGLQPTDYILCAWLRDVKKVNAGWVLNHGDIQTLNQEFSNWQKQQQSQTEIPPKS
jgi:hypothetical protein